MSKRRTKAEINEIKGHIHLILEAIRPASVRGLFYQLVGIGVIPKTENGYDAVCRLTAVMRKDGTLPYGWITDSTRWARKLRTWGSLEEMLHISRMTYRRALWNDQNVYVEVWIEKDALTGVVADITEEWDIRLMSTRGYPSLSFLNGAAELIRAIGKPTYIYYFGDHDPSGKNIYEIVEKNLRKMAPEAEIHFKRVAVNEEHIKQFTLQTRPTKKSDSRSRNFKGESVELDALHPDILRAMVKDAITSHIDFETLESTEETERMEKETLDRVFGLWNELTE